MEFLQEIQGSPLRIVGVRLRSKSLPVSSGRVVPLLNNSNYSFILCFGKVTRQCSGENDPRVLAYKLDCLEIQLMDVKSPL